jgi:HNH endonuclease
VLAATDATEHRCVHRPIMQSPFDLLPSVTGNKLPYEPYPGATSVIGLVFQNTDTTYKFFWFLSVLHKANVAPIRTDLQLEIKELAREMIAQAWPCRRLFKLWFGHQDRLQSLIDLLAEISALPDSARLDEVRGAALELSEAELNILQDFVPYRFLTPWLRSALVEVSDHARNQLIQLLAARSSNSPRPTPYSFDTVIGRPKQIIVGSKWLTFLQSNHLPFRGFAQLSVARYFETRNPGIPGIINKLDRPGVRKLEKARVFWDTILSVQPLKCIYSGEPIQPDYDLDHFLPWSFVTHDLIWNLTPTPGAINLAKSDAVPNLGRYLSTLVDQHYVAMPVLKNALVNVRGTRLRALEAITLEYATFFKIPLTDLFLLSRDQYTNLLSTELHAQADVARRLNFESDWIWA